MQKIKPWRCKKYTDWVKQLPSAISMKPADDPHHVKGVLFTGTTKPHDLFVMPMTRDEHTYLHDKGATEWQRIMQISQSDEIIRTINKALNDGLIEIKWIGA